MGFFLSAGCIALVRESRDAVRAIPEEPTLTHVAGLLRGGYLVRLGAAQILAGSLQLALAFYVLFGRDRLGLTTDWLGSFIVAQRHRPPRQSRYPETHAVRAQAVPYGPGQRDKWVELMEPTPASAMK